MGYSVESKTIYELIVGLETRRYYLPAIQREFVWPSDKVESLFDSLLRGYPVGTLLLWDVRRPAIHEFQFYEVIRDYDVRSPHNIKANLSAQDQCLGILDGQQRITAVNIGLLGSYTEKRPRLWRNNPDAFASKKLYINLLFKPRQDDDQVFQIKFLTQEQARQCSDSSFWFSVGDILKYKTRDELREYRRSSPYRDDAQFERNLDALWDAIFNRPCITYFVEQSQNLDQVLQVFVRLNMGGTPLSYSDLLLSLATASWTGTDARERVYNLVDYLNRDCGSTFSFTKDFVLKALLFLSDRDIRFKTDNVARNLSLEHIWSGVEASLKLAVKFVAQAGFNEFTLTAPNSVIAIAYHLYKHGLDNTYLTHIQYAEDRERTRLWILRMLIGRVFRGQTDRILTTIRTAMKPEVATPDKSFPAESIDVALRKSGFLRFTEEDVERLVSETAYGDPYAFAVLATLTPFLNFGSTFFHVDHMHPQSAFTPKALRDVGMTDADIAFGLENYNCLPNLQLLPGPGNVAKNDTPIEEWLRKQANPGLSRELAFVPNTSLALSHFRTFFEARRDLLKNALRKKLGFVSETGTTQEQDGTQELVTGEPSALA